MSIDLTRRVKALETSQAAMQGRLESLDRRLRELEAARRAPAPEAAQGRKNRPSEPGETPASRQIA